MARRDENSTKRRRVHEKRKEPIEKSADSAWFNDRLRELALSHQDAANTLGVDKYMVSRMITGRRPMRIAEAAEWARLLKVPIAVVLVRLGFDLPAPTVPVVGTVRPNGRISTLPPSQHETAPAPLDTEAGVVAVRVDARHSALELHHGELLYYQPGDGVDPAAFGRLGVIVVEGVSAPIAGVIDRGSAGRANVIVWGGSETIEGARLIAAAPILWRRA